MTFLSLYSPVLNTVNDCPYNYQLSMDIVPPLCYEPVKDYFDFVGDGLTVSLHEGDQPFKKGSNTFPRSELRFTEERPDGEYWFNLTATFLQVPEGMQFSWMQVFASSPVVMLRVRNDVTQMVSFDSKSKITEFALDRDAENRYALRINAKKDGKVSLYINDELLVSVPAKIRSRDKLHLKLGVYAQQMDPVGITSVRFKDVAIDSVDTSGPCICK